MRLNRMLCICLLAAMLLPCLSCAEEQNTLRGYDTRTRKYQYASFGVYPYEKDGTPAPVLWRVLGPGIAAEDDVIDRAELRHGQSSINQKWGKRNAILTGDFILSRIFELGMESLEFDILTYVSHTIKWLCEGEVIQDEQTKTLGMTHEKYYDIIDKKTASLLAISCGVGALAVKAPAREVDAAYEFGRNLGMAFQIKDDILDYAAADQTGKPTCADLREHKITLPLLETFVTMTPEEVAATKELVARGDDEAIAIIRTKVMEHNGMERAERVMEKFLASARAALTAYPESDYRESLEMMCDFLAMRKK
jgi:octaprenyl-diphosphate synthase